MLLVLTCAAGLSDAISYLEFTAALRSTLALAAFSVGAAGGALLLLRERARGVWPPIVIAALALEGVVLAVFGAMWQVTATAARADVVIVVLIALSGSPSRHPRLLAAVFLVYGAGALTGALLQSRSSSLLAWLPLGCVAAVVANGLARRREAAGSW